MTIITLAALLAQSLPAPARHNGSRSDRRSRA